MKLKTVTYNMLFGSVLINNYVGIRSYKHCMYHMKPWMLRLQTNNLTILLCDNIIDT